LRSADWRERNCALSRRTVALATLTKDCDTCAWKKISVIAGRRSKAVLEEYHNQPRILQRTRIVGLVCTGGYCEGLSGENCILHGCLSREPNRDREIRSASIIRSSVVIVVVESKWNIQIVLRGRIECIRVACKIAQNECGKNKQYNYNETNCEGTKEFSLRASFSSVNGRTFLWLIIFLVRMRHCLSSMIRLSSLPYAQIAIWMFAANFWQCGHGLNMNLRLRSTVA